jgi:uncharacterized protein (TIGR01777 family)
MRIGITGGTGFLGRRLLRRLLDRGDGVLVYSRSPDRAKSSLPPPVQLARWDARTEPLPPSTLDGLDAVVNLVGEPVATLWTRERKQRLWDVRVRGTRNLVAGLRAAASPPSVLLSSSATGFYGSRGDEELTEGSGPGTGFLAELARAWEAEAQTAETLGARVVRLRTSLPLDPGGGLLKAMIPPFRLGLGAALGGGNQWMPWIHIEDWIALVLFALDTETLSGPLNLCSPEPARNRVFTRTLGSVLGRPAFLRAPAFAFRLLPGGAAEETVLVSQRAVPARATKLGFSFRFPALEPALGDLLRKPGSGGDS